MEHVAAPSGGAPAEETDRREAEVAARLALLSQRFAATFGPEGRAVARGAIEGAVERDERLRQIPLGNSDEPVGSFIPYREHRRGEPA